jgi:hypothetical protein
LSITPLRLAYTPLDGFGFDESDMEIQTEFVFHGFGNLPADSFKFFGFIGEELGFHFHTQLNVIQISLYTIDDNLIMGLGFLDIHQYVFDLGGKNVHTTDNHHVVGAAQQPMHFHKIPAAGAFAPFKPGDVPSSISKNRRPCLGERGEDQLTFLAVGEHLARLGIDNFRIEVIFVHVQAVLFAALTGHSRTDNFRQAVNIIGFQVHFLFNFPPHVFAPGFSSEYTGFDSQGFHVDPHVFGHFGHVERITRCACQNGGAEVPHKLQLSLGIPAPDGNGVAADGVGTVMDTQTPGKHSISIPVLHNVAFFGSGHHQAPGHHLGPDIHVVPCVSIHHRGAGGSRGGVNLDDIVMIGGQEPVRVGVAKIVLGCKGNFGYIIQRDDICRFHPGLVKSSLVKINPVIEACRQVFEFGQLPIPPLGG